MPRLIVKVLKEKKNTINGDSFIFPLIINKELLSELGIKVIFIEDHNKDSIQCNVLIITSNYIAEKGWWKENKKSEIFNFLIDAKQHTDYIVWADLRDGTGTTFFEILPYIDRYLKGFLLKDKSLYQKKIYGSRIFTDFYHNNFNISDNNAGEPHLNYIPPKDELSKVYLSWNNSFNNFNFIGSRIRLLNKRFKLIPHKLFSRITDPRKERSIFYNCRISTAYSRNTISFPRSKIIELLGNKVRAERLNKRKYYNELSQSMVVISPFGWGEACYRDYEAFNAGAALIKPDCSHMETWPDYYIENETYIPFKWDFSDFEQIIDLLPQKINDLISMAEKAQKKYQYFLFSDSGRSEFCDRFKNLVSI